MTDPKSKLWTLGCWAGVGGGGLWWVISDFNRSLTDLKSKLWTPGGGAGGLGAVVGRNDINSSPLPFPTYQKPSHGIQTEGNLQLAC